MVWKFVDTTKPELAARYKQVLSQISAWWQAFEKEKSDIERYMTDESFGFDMESFVQNNLQVINPDIMWELDGNTKTGECFFIVTAESERHRQPLVETIVESAPKLPNWRFFTHRLARGYDRTNAVLRRITGISADQILFKIEQFAGNSIELVFAFPDAKKLHDMTANQAAFIVAEQLLGEDLLNKWIGSMMVQSAANTSKEKLLQSGFQPTAHLLSAVTAAVNEKILALPNAPLGQFKEKLKWTGFSLEAAVADDYAEQFDMMAATSVTPDVWKAAHSGAPFASIRFSKFGERFCYLKMDGKDNYANSAQSRDRLAKTLDEQLGEAGLGCTTGGAGGLRYSYIELALTDVRNALPVIKEAMAYEHMPERSWLLFWDMEWSNEWVGIFNDTPPPPMMPEPYALAK